MMDLRICIFAYQPDKLKSFMTGMECCNLQGLLRRNVFINGIYGHVKWDLCLCLPLRKALMCNCWTCTRRRGNRKAITTTTLWRFSIHSFYELASARERTSLKWDSTLLQQKIVAREICNENNAEMLQALETSLVYRMALGVNALQNRKNFLADILDFHGILIRFVGVEN